MRSSESMPWRSAEIRPASEKEVNIPERLRNLHEVDDKFLDRGVFFDVYAIELPDDKGKLEPFVFKDFRSGDVIMPSEEQISLFQHQYYEWQSLRQTLGKQFFPESYWVRSKEFSDDEAHGFYSVPGKTANTMQEFIKVQLDRQLADRYSSDDKKKGSIKKVMSGVGDALAPSHENKPFIGAIVQKRIHGLSVGQALKNLDKDDPNYLKFRNNAQALIRGLRLYHDQNFYGAFTWHGLQSDNVMAELDQNDHLTGSIFIVDANFTERPNKLFKDKVVTKLERDVFNKLEEALDLA